MALILRTNPEPIPKYQIMRQLNSLKGVQNKYKLNTMEFDPSRFKHWKDLGVLLQDSRTICGYVRREILYPTYTKNCKLMKTICNIYSVCGNHLQNHLEELMFANIDDKNPETKRVIVDEMSDNVLNDPSQCVKYLVLKVCYPKEQDLDRSEVAGDLDAFETYLRTFHVFMERVRHVLVSETLKTKRNHKKELQKAWDRIHRALGNVAEIIQRDHTEGRRVYGTNL